NEEKAAESQSERNVPLTIEARELMVSWSKLWPLAASPMLHGGSSAPLSVETPPLERKASPLPGALFPRRQLVDGFFFHRIRISSRELSHSILCSVA
ncbi:DNA mismatch repair protein MutS, partial [Dissostichus eleginoides]